MTTKRQTIKMEIISLNALKTVRLLSLMLFEDLDTAYCTDFTFSLRNSSSGQLGGW